MNDDYKQGLITGLAMQPLAVVGTVNIPAKDPNLCGIAIVLGIKGEEGHCAWIEFES